MKIEVIVPNAGGQWQPGLPLNLLKIQKIDSGNIYKTAQPWLSNEQRRGHPLKGESREKTPPRCKKNTFFRLTLDGFVKSPNKQVDNVLKLNS